MSNYLNIPDYGKTLHRKELERDSCGVGAIAHIKGERSHKVLKLGLDSVSNVTHRGALNSDGKTGDGAGVTTTIPYEILIPEAIKLGSSITENSNLAVGVFFLPDPDTNKLSNDDLKSAIESILHNRDIKVIGWRDVPIDKSILGSLGLDTLPLINHLLLEKTENLKDDDQFERALYISRLEIEKLIRKEGVQNVYIPSLSHRLISYKGFLVASSLENFYLDLLNKDFKTSICLYHQRFSTNTFPTWELSQPFRMLCHNGEINTVRGNRNWLNSRINDFQSDIWGEDIKYLDEILDPNASDSSSLDSMLELLVMSGRSVCHAMSMLVPPAWKMDPFTTSEIEDFYQYHSCFSEPWDGPATLAFSDGIDLAASLDRNGLRPARYKISKDGIFFLGSEAGTCFMDDSLIEKKGRLAPGEMILVDTKKGKVFFDSDIKSYLSSRKPYGEWLKDYQIPFSSITSMGPKSSDFEKLSLHEIVQFQIVNGITKEEIEMIILPMMKDSQEGVYSMGDDSRLPVLSEFPQVFFNYFKQLFAQVTNPPIDSIRENLVMSLKTNLGEEKNILLEDPANANVIHLNSPFLFNHQLEDLIKFKDIPSKVFDTTWEVKLNEKGMSNLLDNLAEQVENAIDEGIKIIILSDRNISKNRVPIPSMLSAGAVISHLNKIHKRMKASIIVDTSEARDTHQMACLFGIGVTAICPWLCYETINKLINEDTKNNFENFSTKKALANYHKALEKGVMKIMSKMGISVLKSYKGAQLFESIGIGEEIINKYFPNIPSQISGIGLNDVAKESLDRHYLAYNVKLESNESLSVKDLGFLKFKRDGESHSVTGSVIKNFHTFVKSGSKEDYEEYIKEINLTKPNTIHDLIEMVPDEKGSISINDVEPIENVRRRFTTAAMSLGAIGPEAHEVLAIAMNRIGGKSDSGEGGENIRRYTSYPNGDIANSKIKQIASGRFGVSAQYLISAEELEIKIAQGAKPGEGGQLPGHKVNGLIAKLRNTQPGVTLISPPPHHDIYSIEDLAQLIYDLKQINPQAKITVKLVAKTGIGTIAAGVAKAGADIILISGHDGGTGASPISSIKHAGLPWEIGLAETQQVLMINGLRDKVKLRADGGLRTGVDIIHAAALGAEEYNFGTIALIAMGCVYVRRCHLNNCPVGIATQDPKYRAKFKGKVEHVINFFNAVSQEVREHMAMLGVKKLDDIIGNPKYLRQRKFKNNIKSNSINLDKLLADVNKGLNSKLPRTFNHASSKPKVIPTLDEKIINDLGDKIKTKTPVSLSYCINNRDRNIGTRVSGEVAKLYGDSGLKDETINISLFGTSGQSLATFLCSGIRISLKGEANDYVGKGMSGGKIEIHPPDEISFNPSDNTILGNSIMYGASGGTLFAYGKAGERFCVRNSGALAIVEGVGDHACEYMTNGKVVILGETGKNFGAGMSGGIAYVYDERNKFEKLYNPDMIKIEKLNINSNDNYLLKNLIQNYVSSMKSLKAKKILDNWNKEINNFRLVTPK